MAEHGRSSRSSHPLAEVILCCTSVLPEQRAELAAIAAQMGAQHKLDLTSDVTHLLVGETNTPKYRYVAKERDDVKVLKPEWVEAVRNSWMTGGETDVKALENEYRLPAFAGLSICLTGFDDLSFRAQLQEAITSNGGHYRGDLTKGVTHLIAHAPEGKKYTYANQWQIKIVSLKWFKDSLERGMVLEESLYHPTLPTNEQGNGAWNRNQNAQVLLGKRPREDEPLINGPRKLRRTASTKLGSQNEGIWTDIVGGGFDTTKGLDSPFEGHNQHQDVRLLRKASSTILEAKSFASDTTVAERRSSVREERSQLPPDSLSHKPRGFLHRTSFLVHGFTEKQNAVLQDHLLSHDAELSSSLSELSQRTSTTDRSFVLVPYNLSGADVPSVEHFDKPPRMVTDMWIESCLHAKTFLPPELHVINSPIPKFPISGFEDFRVCSTGFGGIDLLHVSKVVALIGATYAEFLTSNASVLICNTLEPNGEKLRHTVEWRIPCVSPDWLWTSLQSGEKKPFQPYLIRIPPTVKSNIRKVRSKKELEQTNQTTNHDRSMARKDHDVENPDLRTKRPQPSTVATQPIEHNPVRKPTPKQTTIQPTPEASFQFSTADDSSYHPQDDPPAEPLSEPSPIPLREISANSPPEPSSTFSRSQSPIKVDINHDDKPVPPVPAPTSTTKTTYAPPTAENILGILAQKKAIARTPSTSSIPQPGGGGGVRGTNKRGLLGRASSNLSNSSSVKSATGAGRIEMSRASSVDTMNEDGAGSIVEGGEWSQTLSDPNAKGGSSGNIGSFTGRAASAPGRCEESRTLDELWPVRGGEAEIQHAYWDEYGGVGVVDPAGEQQALQMTQLGYEDPDAMALRERMVVARTRGKNSNTKSGAEGNEGKVKRKKVDVGEGKLRDVEGLVGLEMGWGGGRRTRRKG